MVIALGMAHSKAAIRAQTMVTDTTNDLLRKNAETLHQSTVEIATENERGIVDIETLQHTNNELIATLDDLMRIRGERQTAGVRLAEVELVNIENQLKQKLMEATTIRA